MSKEEELEDDVIKVNVMSCVMMVVFLTLDLLSNWVAWPDKFKLVIVAATC